MDFDKRNSLDFLLGQNNHMFKVNKNKYNRFPSRNFSIEIPNNNSVSFRASKQHNLFQAYRQKRFLEGKKNAFSNKSNILDLGNLNLKKKKFYQNPSELVFKTDDYLERKCKLNFHSNKLNHLSSDKSKKLQNYLDENKVKELFRKKEQHESIDLKKSIEKKEIKDSLINSNFFPFKKLSYIGESKLNKVLRFRREIENRFQNQNPIIKKSTFEKDIPIILNKKQNIYTKFRLPNIEKVNTISKEIARGSLLTNKLNQNSQLKHFLIKSINERSFSNEGWVRNLIYYNNNIKKMEISTNSYRNNGNEINNANLIENSKYFINPKNNEIMRIMKCKLNKFSISINDINNMLERLKNTKSFRFENENILKLRELTNKRYQTENSARNINLFTHDDALDQVDRFLHNLDIDKVSKTNEKSLKLNNITKHNNQLNHMKLWDNVILASVLSKNSGLKHP